MQFTIDIPESQDVFRLPLGVLHWSEEEFFNFCARNRELHIERTAKGEILIMSPAGAYSSNRNVYIAAELQKWTEADGTGVAFDSSGGFTLPNNGMRAADAAWVLRSRLLDLSLEEKEKFLPLCPDFVIERASPSDLLSDLHEKMQEFLESGLRLGWLILPKSKTVEIYAPAGMEVLSAPAMLTGDPVLPGFALDLSRVWNPPF